MPLISRILKRRSKDRSKKRAYRRWKRSGNAGEEPQEPAWDPERSYVPETKDLPRRPERNRWTINGPPITDASKVPKGWDDTEPDLDDE